MAPPNTIGPPVCTDLIKQTAIELPQQIIKSHGKGRKVPFFLPEIFHFKKIWKLKLFSQVNIMERMVELGCDPLAANR